MAQHDDTIADMLEGRIPLTKANYREYSLSDEPFPPDGLD
jgi:hypothetical protein